MPQAIKHFSGTAVGQSTTTIYTCPANTVAFVIPSISFNSLNDYTYMVYNSASLATSSYYNWSVVHQGLLTNYNKYLNIFSKVSVSNGATFKAHPDAEYTNDIVMPFFTGVSNESIAQVRDQPQVGKMAPAMIMGAGHKLSLFVQGSGNKTGYNFLILEEAAG